MQEHPLLRPVSEPSFAGYITPAAAQSAGVDSQDSDELSEAAASTQQQMHQQSPAAVAAGSSGQGQLVAGSSSGTPLPQLQPLQHNLLNNPSPAANLAMIIELREQMQQLCKVVSEQHTAVLDEIQMQRYQIHQIPGECCITQCPSMT